MKVLYGVVLFLALVTTQLIAQPTDFDATRGDLGTKKFGFPIPGSGSVADMVGDNSDNLYVIGYANNGANNDITILKLGATGVPVTAYGVNGIATFRFGHGADAGRAGIIDGSGNLLVAGSTTLADGQPHIIVLKLDPNGQPVDAFGDHGHLILNAPEGIGAAMSIISDGLGNFIVGGYRTRSVGATSYNQMTAFKINSNGGLITSFASNGIFMNESTSNDTVYDLVLDNTGNIYLAGNVGNSGGGNMAVLKLDANGQLVPGFATGGKAVIDVAPGKADAAYNIDLDNSGNIILSGYTTTQLGQRSAFAKIGQNGILVDAFGDHGVTVLDNKLVQATKDDGAGSLFFAAAQGNELAAGKLNMTTGLLVAAFGGGDGVASTLFTSVGSNGNGIWMHSNGSVSVAGNGTKYEVARFNTSGVLDVGFNTTGKNSITVGGKTDDPMGMIYDNAGNLYIGGASIQDGAFDPVNTFSIAKLTSTGAIATTFDGDGRLNFNFNGLIDDERPRALGFAANGNLLIAGDSYQSGIGPQMAMAMINPSTGALVGTFGTAGKKIISTAPEYSQIDALANDATGNIVAVGSVTVGNFRDIIVVKLDATGTLVSGFGTAGKKVIVLPDAYEQVAGVKILGDGSILIAAHKLIGTNNVDILVVKLDANGELVQSFGNNGMVITPVGTGNSFDYAEDMWVDASGNIYVAVSFTEASSAPAIIKYNSNGQLATDFGKNGIATFKLDTRSNASGVTSIVLASDGYIYLSGVYSLSSDFNSRHAWVARLNMDGTLTTGYGQDGVFRMQTDNGQETYIRENATGITLATQDDGDFLVAWLKKGPGLTFADVTVQMDATEIAMHATTPGTGAITYSVFNNQPNDIGLNATTGVIETRKSGTFTIAAKTEATTQFASATETATLTINKVPQTITFPITEKAFGVEPFNIGITSSSGLPVTIDSSAPGVITIQDGVATIHDVGTSQVYASQAGNDTYLAATPVSKSFVVSKGNQVITFPEISTKTRAAASFELNATSSSGLSVAYSANNHVSIVNTSVSIISAGRVEITATQTGNTKYNAAEPVKRTFCISPTKPVISLIGDNSTGPLLISSYPDGNQWYRAGTAIDGARGEKFVVSTTGSYTVVTTIEGCASERSDEKVATMGTNPPPDPNNPITGVDEIGSELSLRCFPNPADTEVMVELKSPSFVTVSFSLKDVLGRAVTHMESATNVGNTIDLREVPKGVYFVEAVVEGKRYVTRLVK